MEDSQIYDFTVKSQIHNYRVKFITEIREELEKELVDGDIILIDSNIERLYEKELKEVLSSHKKITIFASEESKSYQGCMNVLEDLIECGFRKNHRLIAIGGGITQDTTAFIASIMYRGVQWLFFPTSLLAQGDSCIGSKTSINFGKYKNQVGGFYPPNKILIDLNFINTLSEKELKSGLGEMCHYFIVSSQEDFYRFKNDYLEALTDKKVLKGIIVRSLEIKKSYIEIDEFDKKERLVFNYGHSFGHAIESLTNYSIPHGIAVSIGMDMANFISVKLGFITEDLRQDIRDLLKQIWQGHTLQGISLEKYKTALSKDKKNIGKTLRLILNKGLGNIVVHPIEMDSQFENWLKEYLTKEI